MYQDKTIVCRDCNQEFVFTAGEQEFYASKGFENEPSRCPVCRSARKQHQSSGNREMHTAICADCGREAQVPFAPNPERPVYCRDCYASRKDKASNW